MGKRVMHVDLSRSVSKTVMFGAVFGGGLPQGHLYSIYAVNKKLPPPFLPAAGVIVRHGGASVGIVRRTYFAKDQGWTAYVEFFWPNRWFHHVLTKHLSPLSTLELVAVVAETDLPERGEISR